MYDFQSLVEEVLKQKPGLARDRLSQLIEEKKSVVGGGYLTDQGALFLVAGELGIKLEAIDTSDLTLRDLYIGANNITVVARVLAVYPVSVYVNKDGKEGRYRRLNLFDKNGVARLTIWDDVEVVDKLGITLDTPVRVVSGYVKEGYDGKPNLNLGKRGRLEVVDDDKLISRMVPISELTQDLNAPLGQEMVAVKGVVSTESRVSSFTRDDGSQGTSTQFGLTSEDGKKRWRVVIWNANNLANLKLGERVRITNLKLKQQSYGDAELHGDSGSLVQPFVSSESIKFLVVSIANIGETVEMMAADERKTLTRLHLRGEAKLIVSKIRPGDAIDISPEGKVENPLVCTHPWSVKLVVTGRSGLPSIESLCVKISDVGAAKGLPVLEVIALSKSASQNVHLNDGSTVVKGEVVIGDDTGEIKLIAWDKVAEKLQGIEKGERLRIVGAALQMSRLQTPILQLNSFSAVVRPVPQS